MKKKHNVIIGNKMPEIDSPEIFIIEEDSGITENLEQILISQNYRIRKAGKLSDAKKSIAISVPDLIILEVQMANGKGYDFCRYLKDNNRTSNVPIIFVNYLAESFNRIDGYRAGGIDFIEFPLDVELVIAQLDIHLKSYYLQSSLLQSYQNVEEHMRRQTANLEHFSEEAKSNEMQFTRIFNEMQEGYLLVSLDGIIKLVNPATFRALGYDAESDLVGTRIAEKVYAFPEQQEKLVELILRDGKVENYEIEFKRKDGGSFIAECHIHSLVEDDETVAFEGLFRDVTLRKQQEMQLLRSEERYADAQRAAHIGSWDWDVEKDELTWSESIEDMFGFEKGEFGGTYIAFMERVHPDDCIAVSDAVQASLEKSAAYRIEHRIVRPDQSVRWVQETGNVVRNEAGEPIRMLGMVQDITERKNMKING